MRLPPVARPLFAALLLSPAASAQISGFVLDAATQAPLAGAVVTEQTTTNSTTAAADGSFLLPVAPGATITVTAARPGYWNKGQVATSPQAVLLTLEALPPGDDPSQDLTSSTNCNFCHQGLYSQWFGAPMARSAENTWLHDMYAGNGTAGGLGGFVYTRDSKHKATNPDGDCASCHAPVKAAKNPGGNTPLDPPSSASPEQLASVACEICHRMESVDLQNALHFPGVVPQKVTFRRPPGQNVPPIMFGPYADASYTATAMRPSYNPLFETAQVCAVCHQDANDHDDDGDYEDPGSVAHQNTWVEWENSRWSVPGPGYADCVDCHMPSVGDTQVCVFGPQRDPSTIHAHLFRGTTRAYLKNAVEMRVEGRRTPTEVVLDVALTNTGAGHAVPTGSDFRNLILLVTAKDAQGNALPYTGTQRVGRLGGLGDPLKGDFAGLPGKLFGRVNTDGAEPGQFFSEAVGIVRDDRLFPFRADRTEYRFQAPAGAVTFEAKLIYRRAWRHIVLEKGWRLGGHGAPLADVEPPHFGEVMELESLVVP